MSKAFQRASYCASCKMKSQEHDINAEQTEIIAPNLEEIAAADLQEMSAAKGTGISAICGASASFKMYAS